MTSAEKISAKLFSAKERDDSSKFMPFVRYVFNFNRHHHGAMVSRYCLVMEWIASKFAGKSDLDVDTIKDAIQSAEGFDCVVELQRAVGKTDTDAQNDAEIIAKAIAGRSQAGGHLRRRRSCGVIGTGQLSRKACDELSHAGHARHARGAL